MYLKIVIQDKKICSLYPFLVRFLFYDAIQNRKLY